MRRKIIFGFFTDLKKIPQGQSFVSQNTLGLRWLAGLWHYWHQLSTMQRWRWRFFVLSSLEWGEAASHEPTTGNPPPPDEWQALLFHQPYQGWWAVCARAPLPPSFLTLLKSLGPVRCLEGDAKILLPLLNPTISPSEPPPEHPRLTQRSLILSHAIMPPLSSTQANTAQKTSPRPHVLPSPSWLPLTASRARATELWRVRLATLSDLLPLNRYFQGEDRSAQPLDREALGLMLLREQLYMLEVPNATATQAGGELLGLCVLSPAGAHAYLRDLYTFPEHRGKGVARQLLSTLIHLCQRAELSLYLCVDEQNHAARHLYESMGFQTEGERFTLRFDPVHPHTMT